MNKIIKSLGLVLLGAVLMGVLLFSMAPAMMIHQLKSPYSVDETVKKISENAKKQGWTVNKVSDMQKSMKKKLGKDILPTKVMKLGQAKYAYTLLSKDDTHFVAAMMPHSVAVYQNTDGVTYVSSMNMRLIGKVFGGETERIMTSVQDDDDIILDFLAH